MAKKKAFHWDGNPAESSKELSPSDIPVCPVHGITLVATPTRYGNRYCCPDPSCDIAWWGRKGTTPADKKTREARKRFADAFMQSSIEAQRVVVERMTSAGHRPGTLTHDQCAICLGWIGEAHAAEARRMQEAELERIRALILEYFNGMTEASRLQFVHWMAERQWSIKSLNYQQALECLGHVRHILRPPVMRPGRGRGRARRSKEADVAVVPVVPTKTKRRIDLS